MLDNRAYALEDTRIVLQGQYARTKTAFESLFATMRKFGMRGDFVQTARSGFARAYKEGMFHKLTIGGRLKKDAHGAMHSATKSEQRLKEYEAWLTTLARIVADGHITDSELYRLGFKQYPPWDKLANRLKKLEGYDGRKIRMKRAQTDVAFAMNMVFGVMIKSSHWNDKIMNTAFDILAERGLVCEYMDRLCPPPDPASADPDKMETDSD